jgi:predicted small secreted protein
MNIKYECIIQYITHIALKVTKENFCQESNLGKPWSQTQPQFRNKQKEKKKQTKKNKINKKNVERDGFAYKVISPFLTKWTWLIDAQKWS